MVRVFAVLAALVLSFAAGSAVAQSSKPWRHGLIMPKSDSGILLMAAEHGFFKQVGPRTSRSCPSRTTKSCSRR